MKPVVWGPALKNEYEALFMACVVRSERLALVDAQAKKIAANKARYEAIAKEVNPLMPWWFVGCIHSLECGCRFDRHLHNGDPLDKKTTHVPMGRPEGTAPWTFERSALDALRHMGYQHEMDFTMGRILYLFEGYNGYGYRQYHDKVHSPYLWSFTNQYEHGKYVADGHWSESAVSEQSGIAGVIKRLFDLKLV